MRYFLFKKSIIIIYLLSAKCTKVLTGDDGEESTIRIPPLSSGREGSDFLLIEQ